LGNFRRGLGPRKRAELAAKNSGKDWITSTWQRSKKAAGWQGSPSYVLVGLPTFGTSILG